MPLAALLACVPLLCEMANAVKVGPSCFAASAPVPLAMFGLRETFKVVERVVERIKVFVVNVVARRYRAICSGPNAPMQRSNALENSCAASFKRLEILACLITFAERESTEFDSVKHDNFDGLLCPF